MAAKEKRVLTPEQEKWLIKHYKHTKNDIILAKLGVSNMTLHKFARELGLKKSKQFMKKRQAEATMKAWEANKANDWPPKGYSVPNRQGFQKGVTNLMRLGKKREAERIAKATAKRMETWRKEKLRAEWGFPQQTKLHVIPCSKKRTSQRHYLKKHGYILDEENSIAYWNEETVRVKRLEAGIVKCVYEFRKQE